MTEEDVAKFVDDALKAKLGSAMKALMVIDGLATDDRLNDTPDQVVRDLVVFMGDTARKALAEIGVSK